jgi:hypothetical protein
MALCTISIQDLSKTLNNTSESEQDSLFQLIYLFPQQTVQILVNIIMESAQIENIYEEREHLHAACTFPLRTIYSGTKDQIPSLFERRVNNLTFRYADVWQSMPDTSPRMSRTYSRNEQEEHQLRIEELISEIQTSAKSRQMLQRSSSEREELGTRLRVLLLHALGFNEEDYSTSFLDDCAEVARVFTEQARAFDSSLSEADIHQALRNVWIVNALQHAFGKPITLTPSGFAYSLLYPYTDNLLDDPAVSMIDKRKAIDRITLRLAGDRLHPMTSYEEKIFALIQYVEDEYPRSTHEDVYKSLMAIHRAQEQSIDQQRSGWISDQEVLTISTRKGGTSVLADGYLAAGTLDDNDEDFCFGFGFLLQLVDDLQDAAEDHSNAHRTIFSMAIQRGDFQQTTNQLLQFNKHFVHHCERLTSESAKELRSLIEDSVHAMVFESIGMNQDLFERTYVESMEIHSPVPFSFFPCIQEQMKSIKKEAPAQLFE